MKARYWFWCRFHHKLPPPKKNLATRVKKGPCHAPDLQVTSNVFQISGGLGESGMTSPLPPEPTSPGVFWVPTGLANVFEFSNIFLFLRSCVNEIWPNLCPPPIPRSLSLDPNESAGSGPSAQRVDPDAAHSPAAPVVHPEGDGGDMEGCADERVNPLLPCSAGNVLTAHSL